MAIPIKAIKKVERVNFELPFSKREKDKYAPFLDQQFEIYLKEDFIDIYLKPTYELRIAECSHGNDDSSRNITGSPGRSSNFVSSSISDKPASPKKLRGSSPGKVRGVGKESHEMSTDEMRARFHNIEEGQKFSNMQDKLTQTVNTVGSWSNREEEWYFVNKRLLFSTKSPEITDQWVEKLNALVTPE